MTTPHRPDAQTPKEVRDIRHAAEEHLFRGMAIANVLRCLTWQYECQWHTNEPFTLHDLGPHDLRIVCEIMVDELDKVHEVISELAPREV